MRRLGLLALLLASPTGATAAPVDPWAAEIREAAARFAIPEQWIRLVMKVESGGETRLNGRPITSRAGAMGLMQLMPATWAEMRFGHGLGPDPYDPRDNVLAGAAYLRAMYDRFGYPGLFAAYNAGPGRYAEHLTRKRQLPAETLAYVARVTSASTAPAEALAHAGPATGASTAERGLRALARKPVPGLFVALGTSGQRPTANAGVKRSRLFAPLSTAPPASD